MQWIFLSYLIIKFAHPNLQAEQLKETFTVFFNGQASTFGVELSSKEGFSRSAKLSLKFFVNFFARLRISLILHKINCV